MLFVISSGLQSLRLFSLLIKTLSRFSGRNGSIKDETCFAYKNKTISFFVVIDMKTLILWVSRADFLESTKIGGEINELRICGDSSRSSESI